MPPKKTEVEYYLRITPYTDSRDGREGHSFELTTQKEFRNFRYDILVDFRVDKKEINIIIRGISTPRLSIPDHGPARYARVAYDLRGTYTLIVSKVNGPQTTFTVDLTPKRTVQKGKTKQTFVKLETTH